MSQKVEAYNKAIAELIASVKGVKIENHNQKQYIIDKLFKLQESIMKDIQILENLCSAPNVIKVDATNASKYDYPDSLTF